MVYQEESILEKLVKKYPKKSWNWDSLSCNPNISTTFISKYAENPWNWYYISLRKNIADTFINENINKFVNLDLFFCNPILSIDKFCKYLDESNHVQSIDSLQKNVTLKFAESNINTISFDKLSRNTFNYYTINYWKERKEETINYCNKIKEELIAIAWSPDRKNYLKWCMDCEEITNINKLFKK